MRLVLGFPFVDLRRAAGDPTRFRVSADPQDWREHHSFAAGVGQVVVRREGSPLVLPNDHLVLESNHALRCCDPTPPGLSLLWRYLILRGPIGWLELGWRVEGDVRRTPARRLARLALSARFRTLDSEELPLTAAARRALDRYATGSWRAARPSSLPGPRALGTVVLIQGEEVPAGPGPRAYGLPLVQGFEEVYGPKVRLLQVAVPVPSPRADDALVALLRLHAADEALRELRRLARRPGGDAVPGAALESAAALAREVRALYAHDGHAARVRGWVKAWAELNPSGPVAGELDVRPSPNAAGIKIFLSYSRHDQAARDTLARLLAPVESHGALVWHDGRLDVGDRFDARIREELAQADIIVFLVSPDLLATPYVIDIEIPAAVRLAAERGTLVLPVLWRGCLWQQTQLAPFQILPEKAVPIAGAEDADAAWLAVAARLGREVERLAAAAAL